jgi:hypothetical protein
MVPQALPWRGEAVGSDERLEYRLPCGHDSAGPACFQCVLEDYLATERGAERLEPRIEQRVPRQLTIAVADPPQILRFAAPGHRK